MVLTDIIDMMAPEDIEEKRWRVLELFRAYTTGKKLAFQFEYVEIL